MRVVTPEGPITKPIEMRKKQINIVTMYVFKIILKLVN